MSWPQEQESAWGSAGSGPWRPNLRYSTTPLLRYEREHPGDLIHISVKKLARFRKGGHRITADRQKGCSIGVGDDKIHLAIDDATRLADVEVLGAEQKATARLRKPITSSAAKAAAQLTYLLRASARLRS